MSRSGPSFVRVVLLFLFALLVSAGVAVALAVLKVQGDWIFPAAASVFVAALVGAAALGREPVRETFAWHADPGPPVRRLLVFTLGVMLVSSGGALVWDGLTGGDPLWSAFFDETVSASQFAAVYLGAVAVGPVAEELAFRGLLQRSLVSRIGAGPAIVATSALFAAWHVRPGDIVGTFLWALPVAWLVWRSGTVVWGVTVHVMNNAIAVLMEAASAALGVSAGAAAAAAGGPGRGAALVGLVMVAAGGAWLLRQCRGIDRSLPAPPGVVGAAAPPRWGAPRRAIFATSVCGFVIAAGLVGFVVERAPLEEGKSYRVGGDGMEPTLRSGDWLVVKPLERPPHRGEVVLVHPFGDPADTYVQRIVAVAGDTVAMRAGRLSLNGREVGEPYAQPPGPRGDSTDQRLVWMAGHLLEGAAPAAHTPATWGPLVVPPGHLLLMGDNRANHFDGRFTGFARCEWVVGAPAHIYWSLGADGLRWGRIGPFDSTAAREAWGDLWRPAPCPGSG